jgi:hypothetical protein
MGLLDFITAGQEAQAANRQTELEDRYNLDSWKYGNKENRLAWRDIIRSNKAQRQNIKANAEWQDATAKRAWQDELKIRDFDYSNQVRQFNESERIYGLQLGYNNRAAAEAKSAENRQLAEVMTAMAFDSQDLFVKMLQEEGQIQAMGTSGRSAAKNLASLVATYGRNQAIQAENLYSANRETAANMREIDLQKEGADLQAKSKRMLQPLRGPDPSAPLPTPIAKITDPHRPGKTPRPVPGFKQNVGLATFKGILSTAETVASTAVGFGWKPFG